MLNEEVNSAKMAAQSAYGGGLLSNGPCRESLLGRIRNKQIQAQNESLKSVRLYELVTLLEKNPDVARILDLMEEVGR